MCGIDHREWTKSEGWQPPEWVGPAESLHREKERRKERERGREGEKEGERDGKEGRERERSEREARERKQSSSICFSLPFHSRDMSPLAHPILPPVSM
jgi:hypothetical protein